MIRRPLTRRLMDAFSLLLCALIAVGFAVNAVHTDDSAERIILGFIAVGFAGMFVRTAPLMLRDWRSDGGRGGS